LPLAYKGFSHSVLCNYRNRLIGAEAGARTFYLLLKHLQGMDLVRGRGLQRTDSFAVLSAVRNLHRLELVVETMRVTLLALAREDGTWVKAKLPADWVERYDEWAQQERLVRSPGEEGKREAVTLAKQTGEDGLLLLSRLDEPDVDPRLRDLEEVRIMRTVWEQQFVVQDGGLDWPATVNLPRGEVIQTPHDPDVRYATKRKGKAGWEGYRAHITETVDEERPRVITDIHTTMATVADQEAIEPIQKDLKEHGLDPEQQVVDRGFVSGPNLADSEERGTELVGEVGADPSPQSRVVGGLTLDQFEVDYEAKAARCPGGCTSVGWSEGEHEGKPVVRVTFAAGECGRCPYYERCVMTKQETAQGRRLLLVEHHDRIRERREEQKSEAFRAILRRRAGIEATLSEMTRAHGLREARYVGLARVSLQNLFIGTATNLKRVARWLGGEKRQSQRRKCLAHWLAAA
jgi:transposase